MQNYTRDNVSEIKVLLKLLNKSITIVQPQIKEGIDLINFEKTPGNSLEITYYSGVVAGNPSGNKNIHTVVYKTGVTTVLTKTIEYDIDDDTVKTTIT